MAIRLGCSISRALLRPSNRSPGSTLITDVSYGGRPRLTAMSLQYKADQDTCDKHDSRARGDPPEREGPRNADASAGAGDSISDFDPSVADIV